MAVAVNLNRQPATDKSNPQHASPKVVKRRPYAHTEAFEIRLEIFSVKHNRIQYKKICDHGGTKLVMKVQDLEKL